MISELEGVLIQRLYDYLRENSPELMLTLEEQHKLRGYLYEKVRSVGALAEQMMQQGQPSYIIEEICFDTLTEDLRPSKYQYLIGILEDEFKDEFLIWQMSSVLLYEVVNLIQHCQPAFERLKFSEENEDDVHLRYEIIGCIEAYLSANVVKE